MESTPRMIGDRPYKDREKYNFPREIDPRTVGFRAQIFYNRATKLEREPEHYVTSVLHFAGNRGGVWYIEIKER